MPGLTTAVQCRMLFPPIRINVGGKLPGVGLPLAELLVSSSVLRRGMTEGRVRDGVP